MSQPHSLENAAAPNEAALVVTTQACEFGAVPDPVLCGPMVQRVEHLFDVIMRKIKAANGPAVEPEDDDEALTALTRPEVRGWAAKVLGASEKEIPPTWVKEVGEGE